MNKTMKDIIIIDRGMLTNQCDPFRRIRTCLFSYNDRLLCFYNKRRNKGR